MIIVFVFLSCFLVCHVFQSSRHFGCTERRRASVWFGDGNCTQYYFCAADYLRLQPFSLINKFIFRENTPISQIVCRLWDITISEKSWVPPKTNGVHWHPRYDQPKPVNKNCLNKAPRAASVNTIISATSRERMFRVDVGGNNLSLCWSYRIWSCRLEVRQITLLFAA